jgi:hypothetical protein
MLENINKESIQYNKRNRVTSGICRSEFNWHWWKWRCRKTKAKRADWNSKKCIWNENYTILAILILKLIIITSWNDREKIKYWQILKFIRSLFLLLSFSFEPAKRLDEPEWYFWIRWHYVIWCLLKDGTEQDFTKPK